jgi:hypothetical protein
MPTTYEPDTYYRFSPFAMGWVATSGIMNYCQAHQCFWVLDSLASYIPALAKLDNVNYFLIVQVEVKPDQSTLFTIQQEAEDGYRVLVQQMIEFTDLKDSWKFWAINENPGAYDPECRTVVLLPTEY